MSNSQNFYSSDGFFNAYPSQQQQQQQQYGYDPNQQQQSSPFYDPSFFSNQPQPQFYNPLQPQPQTSYQPTDFFVPSTQAADGSQNTATNFEQEPPLLEELGINFHHIYRKTVCVLNPFAKPHETIIHDTDLAGPLVFCVAYGFSLLLLGKIQFGYVYGITVLGCLCMYMLLNLMSDNGVSGICISSILGYCLLPMVILSFLANIILLKSLTGLIVSALFIAWCSISASKLFVYALNMSNQQLLVLYPCSLLYGIFALLNIF
jgi:hypothetical protein